MKKNKIEINQCYSYHDHVYMVMRHSAPGWWVIQDTLTKEETIAPIDDILTWRRPFDTNDG